MQRGNADLWRGCVLNMILWTAGQAKLVPLEGLLPHLSPVDKEAVAAVQEARKKLAEAVDKIGVVSLTQAAAEKVTPVLCTLRGK